MGFAVCISQGGVCLAESAALLKCKTYQGIAEGWCMGLCMELLLAATTQYMLQDEHIRQ